MAYGHPARSSPPNVCRHGILDDDFIDSQPNRTVHARVIANCGGAEFMITLFQPPSFTDAFFDEQMKLVDIELAKLKELLEKVSWELASPGCQDRVD